MPDQANFELRIVSHLIDDDDQTFEDVEAAFYKSFEARRKTIESLREAAIVLDEIADTQRGLEVGGGVVSVVGKTFGFNFISVNLSNS